MQGSAYSAFWCTPSCLRRVQHYPPLHVVEEHPPCALVQASDGFTFMVTVGNWVVVAVRNRNANAVGVMVIMIKARFGDRIRIWLRIHEQCLGSAMVRCIAIHAEGAWIGL